MLLFLLRVLKGSVSVLKLWLNVINNYKDGKNRVENICWIYKNILGSVVIGKSPLCASNYVSVGDITQSNNGTIRLTQKTNRK